MSHSAGCFTGLEAAPAAGGRRRRSRRGWPGGGGGSAEQRRRLHAHRVRLDLVDGVPKADAAAARGLIMPVGTWKEKRDLLILS